MVVVRVATLCFEDLWRVREVPTSSSPLHATQEHTHPSSYTLSDATDLPLPPPFPTLNACFHFAGKGLSLFAAVETLMLYDSHLRQFYCCCLFFPFFFFFYLHPFPLRVVRLFLAPPESDNRHALIRCALSNKCFRGETDKTEKIRCSSALSTNVESIYHVLTLRTKLKAKSALPPIRKDTCGSALLTFSFAPLSCW